MREGKLLKQQNQGLHLYKIHTRDIYAQWAVESMYLISLGLRFETKILDIAYLLLLKLMKEPSFEIDQKFIQLYLKILTKQGKYKEALDFIDSKSAHFEGNKIDRQLQEADLYFKSNNSVLTINTYFSILRANSRMDNYKEIFNVYQKCIRIFIDDFLPKTSYKFLATPEFLAVESTQYNQNANFEAITQDDRPVKILKVLYHSIRNLRKNL